MSTVHAQHHTGSISQNQKAQLATAYNELGRELSSSKMRVVGNYTLGRVIGEGAYGKVRMGTHRLTSVRVAVKQIPKAMSSALTREIHHHRQLHHPNITQMYEVIATESAVWIVTELCSGGELFDYLVEKERLSEEETKIMFGQLCLAVAYLHDKGIVHRDLKLENVLLDERCRVKLGDFGFTREFEKGSLMETFCGTTGYASPEMLQGKKYQGPEVDVWSLGIILYCLLTGTLPFDDDDERVMKSKIIQGEFEDPEWLSNEARDLIKGILVKDTSTRLTIPQILGHSWFKLSSTVQEYSPDHLSPEDIPAPRTPSPPLLPESNRTSEASSHSDCFASASASSPPTTPDHSLDDPFIDSAVHANLSQTTIRKPVDIEPINAKLQYYPETVFEEEDQEALEVPSPLPRTSSSSLKAPPTHPTRTPARTKRRSMSSTLSDPDAPDFEKNPSLPFPRSQELDFPSLLTTPAPIIFSTPLERDLLNNLNSMGFDLGQIVYSVLNDACDAAGALWWMLKRKAEKRLLEDPEMITSPLTASVEQEVDLARAKFKGKTVANAGTQTDPPIPASLVLGHNATPHFALVPPTPTASKRPSTPPRPATSPGTRTLTPSSSLIVDPTRSHPNTPTGSLKGDGTKGRKNRSGSVSIMQRATTALEAAGLVRKKSSEAMDKDREKERRRTEDAERRSQHSESERKSQHIEEPRTSHASTSSAHKLSKSPPLKASKGPSTPPPSNLHQHVPSSPWVLAGSRDSSPHRETTASPTATLASPTRDVLGSVSSPDLSPSGKGAHGSHRNRANLLTAFRLWFNEDKKGKRKESTSGGPNIIGAGRGRPVMPVQSYSTGSVKRRTNERAGRFIMRGGRRANRGSVSSRRSSSVNSRRSSINSTHMGMMESPSVLPGRRSFGAHTPNSERGDYPSRPSSVRSFSTRHRKSPSASSSGSQHYRTQSPSMQKYHRRGGSGNSTRVVRQVQARHGRSNSTTSSLHSPPSSRPASYHEYSDNEGYRTGSPYRPHSRRSLDETPRKPSGNATFLAAKRTAAYLHSSSVGRSSWKKSWGLEPPGWQTRTAHHPIEVLSISPPEGNSIRDVFSGRQSFSLGDESDWVDEDEDDVPYAGGLGQVAHHGHTSTTTQSLKYEQTVTINPAPRGHRPNKRAGSANQNQNASGRGKGHSGGSGRSSPVVTPEPAPEARGGRRQLPAGRSGPAFKVAIQEEDEEDEDE